jgi:hypothetical protein
MTSQKHRPLRIRARGLTLAGSSVGGQPLMAIIGISKRSVPQGLSARPIFFVVGLVPLLRSNPHSALG